MRALGQKLVKLCTHTDTHTTAAKLVVRYYEDHCFVSVCYNIICRYVKMNCIILNSFPIMCFRKEGRKEGTCLFDINIKHNTEIFIGKIISGDSH